MSTKSKKQDEGQEIQYFAQMYPCIRLAYITIQVNTTKMVLHHAIEITCTGLVHFQGFKNKNPQVFLYEIAFRNVNLCLLNCIQPRYEI